MHLIFIILTPGFNYTPKLRWKLVKQGSLEVKQALTKSFLGFSILTRIFFSFLIHGQEVRVYWLRKPVDIVRGLCRLSFAQNGVSI
jgi:hypothetical protein